MPIPFITLIGSAARTVTGNGDSLDVCKLAQWDENRAARAPQLLVQANVSAISGSGATVTVTIQDSLDGVNWNNIGIFAAITTVSRLVIAIGLRGDAYPTNFRWPFNPKFVRAIYTIAGTTPSITFDVKSVLV